MTWFDGNLFLIQRTQGLAGTGVAFRSTRDRDQGINKKKSEIRLTPQGRGAASSSLARRQCQDEKERKEPPWPRLLEGDPRTAPAAKRLPQRSRHSPIKTAATCARCGFGPPQQGDVSAHDDFLVPSDSKQSGDNCRTL